jgi:hypothetical protein
VAPVDTRSLVPVAHSQEVGCHNPVPVARTQRVGSHIPVRVGHSRPPVHSRQGAAAVEG